MEPCSVIYYRCKVAPGADLFWTLPNAHCLPAGHARQGRRWSSVSL